MPYDKSVLLSIDFHKLYKILIQDLYNIVTYNTSSDIFYSIVDMDYWYEMKKYIEIKLRYFLIGI